MDRYRNNYPRLNAVPDENTDMNRDAAINEGDIKDIAHVARSVKDVNRRLKVQDTFGERVCSNDEIAHAQIRANSVCMEHIEQKNTRAEEPNWFAGAFAAANAPTVDLLKQLLIGQRKLHNKSCGDGVTDPWEEVPTPNGQMPRQANDQLPELNSVNDLVALTDDQLDAYLDLYQQRHYPRELQPSKRKKLLKAIGSSIVLN
ncbi:hypothetical protein MIR68_002609 [Amoeboaphelidium protococcarum]|nr:hypothetical protein MIR68_002609 [Amoeboaphelidium protococcarum]